jgi:hypothetical protein
MKLKAEKREALLARTVTVVLELRRQHLQQAHCNPMKHWQQIHDRLRMAARTSTSVAEWSTKMQRSLSIGVPSSSLSSAMVQLSDEVECIPQPAWLDLLEQEHAYVMALARLEAEDRKAQRNREVQLDPEDNGTATI